MSQEAKPAAQKRSRATRDKLIVALEELLREKYFDQISVAEIAERAGVAVGTVYRRFENKEAFIPVMLEQHRLRQEENVKNPKECLELSGEESLREALRECAIYTWRQIGKEAHILRTLWLYARLRPEMIGENWNTIEEQALEQIKQLVEHYRHEIKRTDLDRAAAMTFYFFNFIFIEKGLHSDLSPLWLSEIDGEVFAKEMADFAYGYLTTSEE